MLWFRHRVHPIEDEISAFLDGELENSRSIELSAHFETCASCRAILDDFGAVQALVTRLPFMDAPRSFVLTPEMAGASAGQRPARRMSMALSPAVALAVLVALVAVDIGGFSDNESNDQASRGAALGSQTLAADADDRLDATSVAEAGDGGESAATSGLEPEAPAAAGDTEARSAAPAPAEAGPAEAAPAEAAPAGAEESIDEPEASPLASEPASDEAGEGRNWLRLLEIGTGLAFVASLWLFVNSRRVRKV